MPSGVTAVPTSFEVGDEQYIAVQAGWASACKLHRQPDRQDQVGATGRQRGGLQTRKITPRAKNNNMVKFQFNDINGERVNLVLTPSRNMLNPVTGKTIASMVDSISGISTMPWLLQMP